MSFTEQQLSDGIRTNHEFSDSKRRLKRPRDVRDSSRQTLAKRLPSQCETVALFLSLANLWSPNILSKKFPLTLTSCFNKNNQKYRTPSFLMSFS